MSPLTRALAGLLATAATMQSVFAIEPEQVSRETLGQPQASWVVSRDSFGPRYVLDVASGEMVGMISTPSFTPALVDDPIRQEIYAAESYFTRGTRGKRNDVLTVYDYENFAVVDEIDIPDKIAALSFPQYLAMMDDRRYLAVFNLTPAMSVSIVDVEQRKFVTEISTPACSMIMPTPDRTFLQICADGKRQMIKLDDNGAEIDRSRSEVFFDLEKDPVFAKPIATPQGWLMVSYHGKVHEAVVNGDEIEFSEPWSLVEADDLAAGWRPGGGQFKTYYAPMDLLFVLMNPGGEFSHDDPGTQVWIYDRSNQRRIARLELASPGTNLHVSPGEDPLLTVTGADSQLHVYDVKTNVLLRSIGSVGVAPGLLQGFSVEGAR